MLNELSVWVCKTNKNREIYYFGTQNKIRPIQHFVRVDDLVCETGDIFYMHGFCLFIYFFLVSRHRTTYCVWSRVSDGDRLESMNLQEK